MPIPNELQSKPLDTTVATVGVAAAELTTLGRSPGSSR
jgi:hypothetical protein